MDALKRIGKWTLLFILGLSALFFLDIYTFEIIFEDPGYYVVARHSESPTQVLDAIDRLEQSRNYTGEQLESLIRRFRVMKRKKNISEERRSQWKLAEKRTLKLYRNSSHDSTPP